MFLWYDSCFYVRYIDSTIVNVAFQRTISNTRQKTKYVYFTKIDEVAFFVSFYETWQYYQHFVYHQAFSLCLYNKI